MYQARILDKDRQLKAILPGVRWHYNRRINEATDVSIYIPRETIDEVIAQDHALYGFFAPSQPLVVQAKPKKAKPNKAQYAEIAAFIQIYKGDVLKASGKIVGRTLGQVVTVFAATEEILLESNLTPAQYGKVWDGWDLADVARDLLDGWQTLRVKAQEQWQDRMVASSNVDLTTDPGLVMLAKRASGQYYDSGYITLVFNKSEIPHFKSWDRVRWSADSDGTGGTVQTTIQWSSNGTSFTTPFDGGLPEEIGLYVGGDHDQIWVRINLTTKDTESPDPEDNPVGVTPTVFSCELIARTEGKLAVGSIPSVADATVKGLSADHASALQVLVQACEQVGWEFSVWNGALNIAEALGVDRTKDFVFRAGTNIEIQTLGDGDDELCNVLTAYGPGQGINRMEITLRDEASIAEFGEYPLAMEFDAEKLDDLQDKAQEFLDEHNSPKTQFEVFVAFDHDREPDYGLGDKVRVADPETGIVTTARIMSEAREYGASGLTVNLELGKPSFTLSQVIGKPKDGKDGEPGPPGPPGKPGQPGEPGQPGQSVKLVYSRNMVRPSTPAPSPDVPAGWSDMVDLAPGSGPLWGSVGTRTGTSGDWTWQIPVMIEGPKGDPGPVGVYQGVWVIGREYYGTEARGDIVKGSDDRYYICVQSHTAGEDDEPIEGEAWEDYWREFGEYFESVATKILLAEESHILNRLHVGAGGEIVVGENLEIGENRIVVEGYGEVTQMVEVDITEDTYVSEEDPNDTSTASYLDVYGRTQDRETWIKVPAISGTIISGRLKLYIWGLNSTTFTLSPASSDWSADTLTWNNKPNIDAANSIDLSPGIEVSGNDKWATFDITTIIQKWQSGEINNYGLCISTSESKENTFSSSRDSNSSWHPYVEYTLATSEKVTKAVFGDLGELPDNNGQPIPAGKSGVWVQDGYFMGDISGSSGEFANGKIRIGDISGKPWGNEHLPPDTLGMWGDEAGIFLRGYPRLIAAGTGLDEQVIDLSNLPGVGVGEVEVLVAAKEVVTSTTYIEGTVATYVAAEKDPDEPKYTLKAKSIVKSALEEWGTRSLTTSNWNQIYDSGTDDTDFIVCRPNWYVYWTGLVPFGNPPLEHAELWMDITNQFSGENPVNWQNVNYFKTTTWGGGTLNWDMPLPSKCRWAIRVRGIGDHQGYESPFGNVDVYAESGLSSSGYRINNIYLDSDGYQIQPSSTAAQKPSGMSLLYFIFNKG